MWENTNCLRFLPFCRIATCSINFVQGSQPFLMPVAQPLGHTWFQLSPDISSPNEHFTLPNEKGGDSISQDPKSTLK